MVILRRFTIAAVLALVSAPVHATPLVLSYSFTFPNLQDVRFDALEQIIPPGTSVTGNLAYDT